jgi:hypothetical protein
MNFEEDYDSDINTFMIEARLTALLYEVCYLGSIEDVLNETSSVSRTCRSPARHCARYGEPDPLVCIFIPTRVA